MNRRSIRARGDGSQPDLMYSKSMVSSLRKQAAKKFVEYWTFNRPGSKKSGCQQYWNMLFGELLGMGDLASGIRYEVPVQVSAAPSTKHWPSEATQPKAYALSTKFLDAWIPSTHVLIEQKSRGVKLDALFYVMCWHKKAADYMNANGRTTRDAFEIRPQLFDQHCVQCLPLAG